jgi:hypothetical protein
VGLLLGLGCAGLLVLGAAGAAGVYFYVIKPAQEVKQAVEAASQLGGATVSLSDGGIVVQEPNGVTANVTDAGIVVQTPGGATVPLNSLGLASGGPLCEQAASCCKSLAEKTGSDPSTLAVCGSFKSMPSIGCQKALEAYRQSAKALGAVCP